jgi:hypothetical protein
MTFMDEAVRVSLRFGATVLIGAGVGGFAAIVGARELSLLIGVVFVGIGGLFVAVTWQAWNFGMIRRWAKPLDPGLFEAQKALLSPGLFRWITLGLFGVGAGVGALVPLSWYVAMLALATGLIAWALTSDPRAG